MCCRCFICPLSENVTCSSFVILLRAPRLLSTMEGELEVKPRGTHTNTHALTKRGLICKQVVLYTGVHTNTYRTKKRDKVKDINLHTQANTHTLRHTHTHRLCLGQSSLSNQEAIIRQRRVIKFSQKQTVSMSRNARVHFTHTHTQMHIHAQTHTNHPTVTQMSPLHKHHQEG